MNRYAFLGDVHGDIGFCRNFAKQHSDRQVIQIGDLGVGTSTSNGGGYDEHATIVAGWLPPRVVESLPSNFKFFVGNHDNRSEAIKLKNCLGNYGRYQDFFFVSGASSYDKACRIMGQSWWPDEELSYEQADEAIALWEKDTSKMLVCHDCPHSIAWNEYGMRETTFTRKMLQAMIEARKPEIIIYGHHHKTIRGNNNGIRYYGLPIAGDLLVDISENNDITVL